MPWTVDFEWLHNSYKHVVDWKHNYEIITNWLWCNGIDSYFSRIITDNVIKKRTWNVKTATIAPKINLLLNILPDFTKRNKLIDFAFLFFALYLYEVFFFYLTHYRFISQIEIGSDLRRTNYRLKFNAIPIVQLANLWRFWKHASWIIIVIWYPICDCFAGTLKKTKPFLYTHKVLRKSSFSYNIILKYCIKDAWNNRGIILIWNWTKRGSE